MAVIDYCKWRFVKEEDNRQRNNDDGQRDEDEKRERLNVEKGKRKHGFKSHEKG